MPLPYDTVEYWDDRYRRRHQPFEWYVGWEPMAQEMTKLLDEASGSLAGLRTMDILVVGTGASLVAEKIADFVSDWSGPPSRVLAIDWSAEIIARMKDRNRAAKPPRKLPMYEVMDLTALAGIPPASQAVVVDKATLDCTLSGASAAAASSRFLAAVSEVKRVLRPGGTFVHVTFAKATDSTLKATLLDGWSDVSLIELRSSSDDDALYFMYTFRKAPASSS